MLQNRERKRKESFNIRIGKEEIFFKKKLNNLLLSQIFICAFLRVTLFTVFVQTGRKRLILSKEEEEEAEIGRRGERAN